MKITAINNINFTHSTTTDKPKEDKKGLSTTAKSLIGAGIVAAGTLAVYFITRNSKAAKNTTEILTKPNTADTTEIVIPKEHNFLNQTVKDEYNKLNEKIRTLLDKSVVEFKDLTLNIIKPYKNDCTRIEFNSLSDKGDNFREIFIFDKNNDLKRQISRSKVLETTLNQFPIEFVETTKIKFADNKTNTSIMSYYTDMLPKKYENTIDGKTTTYIYGYDLNSQPSGIAYTKGDKVILKLNGSKKSKEFDSFEDLFKKVDREDFKMR